MQYIKNSLKYVYCNELKYKTISNKEEIIYQFSNSEG